MDIYHISCFAIGIYPLVYNVTLMKKLLPPLLLVLLISSLFGDQIRFNGSIIPYTKSNVKYLGIKDNKIYYFDYNNEKKYDDCLKVKWIKNDAGSFIIFDCTINSYVSTILEENNNNSLIMVDQDRYKLKAELIGDYGLRESIYLRDSDSMFVNHAFKHGLYDYKSVQKRKKKWFRNGYYSIGISIASHLIRNILYDKYLDANNQDDALKYHNQMQMFDLMRDASALMSCGAFGMGLYQHSIEKSLKEKLDLD